MNRQLDVIRQLQKMGVDPSSEVSPQDYDKARLAIRTKSDIIRDGVRVGRARAEAKIGLKQVTEERAVSNLDICRSNKCGSYGKLRGSVEVCHRCNCMGKDLHTKARSSREKCPAGLWDNTNVSE